MVQIRQAKKDDLEVWLEMRCQLWPSNTKESHQNEMLESISDKNFVAFLAEDDGKPVGFLEAFVRPFANGCESRPVPFLEGIWVTPSYRKQGISKLMLSKFEEWVANAGFSEIGSDVEISNESSISAHQAWGFQETERVVYFKKEVKL